MLRPATNHDADQVRSLVFGILASYGLTPDLKSTDRDLDDLESAYLRRGGWFGVIERDGKIVGCYGLYPEGDSRCELRKMYLAPELRGQGLGRRMLEDALGRAKRLGFREIHLETASVLKDATKLYRAYGFEPYAACHLSARCDQAMRKVLATDAEAGRFTIREADYVADIPAVAALFEEYAASLNIDLTFQGFRDELAKLPGYYAPPSGRIFLAWVDGAPVGVVALRAFSEGTGELKRLYVRPACRGLGIAKALAERIVAEADAMGYARLYLDTLESMTAAKRVYETLGFVRVAPYYENPLPDVVYYRRDRALPLIQPDISR